MNYKKFDIVQEIVDRKTNQLQSTKTILEWLTKEKGYKLTMAYKYYKEAQQKIESYFDKSNEYALAEAMAQLEAQQQTAKENKNYKLAFTIRQEMNKIRGLQQQKIDVTTNGQPIQAIQIEIVHKTKDETKD